MALSLIFVLLFTLVINQTAAAPATLKSRAVSQDLLNRLSFYEQYAAAAYCSSNNDPGSNTTIICSAGNCPLVQADGAQSVLEFENVGASDATGFVSVDHSNKLIVISFRGSRSVENWIANFVFVMESWSICDSCEAHTGWLDSWNGVKPQITSALNTALSSNPGYKIVATGHSLGGALATLAAADLRSSGLTVDLYTYGSPMVGNRALATFITNQSSANFRVTHEEDVVPKLPGYGFSYAHVSPEYWITSDNDVTVTANDVEVSTGIVDFSGNGGTLGISVDDHSWYFNAISACQD